MKLHKIFLFAVIALATAFTSCSSDDDYQPGQPAGKYNVTFVDQSTVILAQAATEFEITLQRSDANGELSVPVTIARSDMFALESATATFPNGIGFTTVKVKILGDMEPNVGYNLELQIPEEYTNPYLAQPTYPIYASTIMKEDYTVFGEATYTDDFWTGVVRDVTIEYSPSQDLYRVKDMFDDGYNFFFKWNKETNVLTGTNASGAKVSYIASPYLYKDGDDLFPIVAYVNQAPFTYIPETKTFDLAFYWYVPALGGGFGVYACPLVLK